MRQNATYNKTVLKNGLRIITEKVQDVRSIALGIWIDVGSRDEIAGENGLSHFIEHMVFKGTRNRSAREIASTLESLGGNLNAFTSREQTCYHALVLDEHLNEAVDVITDIISHSTLTPKNIEREKLVVIEEIHEVLNTPSDWIHELFYNCFWRNQPLGWPIMGSEESVAAFKRGDILNYMKKHYQASRIVVAAAGNVSHKKLVELITRKLPAKPGIDDRGEATVFPSEFSLNTYKTNVNQTHLCLGFPGLKYNDKYKYALLLLHYYLGGGMSSILFQKIREQKGMAYTIYSFPDFYRDCGLFGIYMATDRRHLKAAVPIILNEVGRLKRAKLDKAKLDKIKEQCKGHLLLGMESTTSRMNRLARQEILSSEYVSYQETIKLIEKVQPSDITDLARAMFIEENLNVTTLGSAEKGDFAGVDWAIR